MPVGVANPAADQALGRHDIGPAAVGIRWQGEEADLDGAVRLADSECGREWDAAEDLVATADARIAQVRGEEPGVEGDRGAVELQEGAKLPVVAPMGILQQAAPDVGLDELDVEATLPEQLRGP